MVVRFGELIERPVSLKGIYLIPLAWMHYGLENGYLTIQNPRFWRTVQGKAYALYYEGISQGRCFGSYTDDDNQIVFGLKDDPDFMDCTTQLQFGVYSKGTGQIDFICPVGEDPGDQFYFSGDSDSYIYYEPEIYKRGVPLCSLEYMENCTPRGQDMISQGLIQLLYGTKVRIESTVWFY